jgi:RimJ/RimL family protein N-acetyltransferase
VTADLRSDDRWLPADWGVDLGDGLRLKGLTDAHKEPFWTAVDEDRGDLSTWMDWPRNLTRAASDAEIDRLCSQASSGEQVPVVMEVGGQFAGQASLYGISRFLGVAEITYWLRPAVRGRAFATRTVAALVTYAIEEMAMARVHARVAVENRTSRAVLERLALLMKAQRDLPSS